MAVGLIASTADPAVRGDAGFQGAMSPPTDLIRSASPRTADGRFAATDAGVIKAIRVERPRRKRLGPCSCCGAYSSGGTCEAHDDLPDLDRGVFRDFCSGLKAVGA